MWDIKYRPKTFAEVLGQEGTVKVLKSRLARGTALDTSYIFSGLHGSGKTTFSRILGRALLCQDLRDGEPCNECDNCEAILNETSVAFTELDAASKGTIDNIRRIVDDLDFVVQGAAKRIYVLDESHRMSRDSQDVLLKPLEDKKLVGIFCTTEPTKIRGTIRSRCEEYPIRKITREDILARMKLVLEKEGVGCQDDAVLTVIDHCGGHVRDVLNRLEMIAQMGDITVDVVRDYLELGLVSVYYKVLLSLGDPAEALSLVDDACDRVGANEVSSGIAEAAMSSYRLANNMFTEFTYVDRDLAKKVYDTYGDEVVRLAEYFLSRRASKVSLICDIVRCAGGVPAKGASQPTSTPVVVQVAAPVQEQPPVPTPGPTKEPSKPVQEAPPAAAPSKPAPPNEVAPPVQGKNSLREDGIGNMGSLDPLALTSKDTSGTPVEMPRGNSEKPMPAPKLTSKKAIDDILTPEQWTRELIATVAARGRSV